MGSDFAGRKWQVSVTPYGQAKRDRKAERDRVRDLQRQADELAVMGVVDQLARDGEPATLTRIRNGSGIPKERNDAAIERLRLRKIIRQTTTRIRSGRGGEQDAIAFIRTPE